VSQERKRALVVAYFFPPLGGAGVQRSLKFVKYLPSHGYDPVVLTTRARWYPARDEDQLAEVPHGTPVLRAPELPIGPLRELLRNPLHRLGMGSAVGLVGWPDPQIGWVPGALWTAMRAVRQFRPSVVYTTSAPYSANLLGLAIHRLTGIPWVADYRDEWTHSPHQERQPKLVRSAGGRLERQVVASAARVVVVDGYYRIEGLPLKAPKREVIPNGIDPADVPVSAASPREGPFRLAHVGTLYGDRDCGPVLRALERLAGRGAIRAEGVELRLVGNVFLPRPPAAGPVPVQTTGYVSHRRAVEEMSSASALLFFAPESTPATSGKIFEYLAADRPVLCVARKDNLAYQLVDEFDAGVSVEPNDHAGIEAGLATLYERWHAGDMNGLPGVRERVLERFSRQKLTGDLARVLDEAQQR
jgi:glycosyltransferase involved in cell wall biosynthesis